MSSESQHLLTAQQLEHDVIEQHGEERGEPIQQQQQQPSSTYGATTTARVVTIKDSRMVKPVGLSWHNLTVVHPKSGRVILGNTTFCRLQRCDQLWFLFSDKVSGMALPGQLVALMGASGAGKTTLLNTLLSRNLKNLHVEGQVLVNGHELGSEITYASGVSSPHKYKPTLNETIIFLKYVQQDELFMGTLTVKEHLLIQARLRLVGFSEKKIRRRVNEVLPFFIISFNFHCLYLIDNRGIGPAGLSQFSHRVQRGNQTNTNQPLSQSAKLSIIASGQKRHLGRRGAPTFVCQRAAEQSAADFHR